MIVTNPAHYIYDYDGSNGGYHVALEVSIQALREICTWCLSGVVERVDEDQSLGHSANL